MPRFDEDWIDSMLQNDRRGSPPAEETLRDIGLHRGDVVADIGSGPGFFTIPALQFVAPTGWVHAIDREPRMLSVVESHAREQRLDRLQTHLATGAQIPLADASVDVTICSLLLHDVESRETFVAELGRITRPHGRIVVVEWIPEPNETRPNRIAPDLTVSLFESIGRVVQINRSIGPRQYLVVAQ
ncbi:MAG TPA: methyltransferase domain-containing protein [Chloroflexota bacterium]|nr:methyltransferase domain-containing protein [Chloroflexota bacterium]